MKVLLAAAELLHSDRQTGRHDVANIPFSQFCERSPKLQNLKTIVSSPLVSGPECTQTTPFLGSSLHLNP